ncbi:MAG: hypothetical protein FWF11_04400, partial [Coriobacteriia bacterium]|nr:hypothetical protein [Coriobacteriia bacterium]
MTAKMSKFRGGGGLSRKSKGALLLAAIFLLALPFLAAANSSAVQSVFDPVVTQIQNMLSPADDAFAPNETPTVVSGGIALLSSLDISQGATTFSAGSGHSLAIKPDGTLWAWGWNSNARTGLNTTVGNQVVPVQVDTATNWAQVSAGDAHSLATRTDGTLWAWGSNLNARTGRSTVTGNQLVPIQVDTATNWTQVSAGWEHSLAIRADGTLWAWGANDNGRTGRGITTGNTLVPTQVGTATNWLSVSSGQHHSLGIRSDGTLWAWGNNTSGATGLGTLVGVQSTPAQIGTATNWAQVSAGSFHSLAVRADGTLWTWGSNLNGRTGLDTAVGTELVPTQVGNESNWTQASAGTNHSLAIKANGTLWA